MVNNLLSLGKVQSQHFIQTGDLTENVGEDKGRDHHADSAEKVFHTVNWPHFSEPEVDKRVVMQRQIAQHL